MLRLRNIFTIVLVVDVHLLHSMVNINYEGQVCTYSFKWLMATTINRKHLEESVDNVNETGNQLRAQLSGLQDRIEEEKTNLGQGGDYSLFHHKYQYLKSSETCSNQFEIQQNEAIYYLNRIFHDRQKREPLSGDATAQLFGQILDFSGKGLDYLEKKQTDRKIGNLEKEVNEKNWLLGGKIEKVSSSLDHFADMQVTRNNIIDHQIQRLHGKTKDALKNITERIDSDNEFISFYQTCQNALNSAKEVNNHLKDVQTAVGRFRNEEPAAMVVSGVETREMTIEFQKRTNQEAFFSPEDSTKLIKFAAYEVIKADQGLILMATFRIPTRKFTHSLYSFTPVVHYYPDEDQFCKLDEGAEALIWTDSGSVAHLSQQQLSECQKSNEIIICDTEMHFSSLEVESESCGVTIMSNSSISEVSRNCNVNCYKDDKPQVVDLKNGSYSITVKAPTPYLLICGFDPTEKHTLEIGQSVLQVQEGCTANLDSNFDLHGKALEFHDAHYKEFQLKTPKFQLKDIVEARKKFLESDIKAVDDFGELESITDNINEVGDIFERDHSTNQLKEMLPMMVAIASFASLLGVFVIFLRMLIRCCRKNRISANENV